MAVSSINAPTLDPRVEFWSDLSRWPRNCSTHVFLGWIVHDLGPIIYKNWTGEEPSTALVYPLWPSLDSSTPQRDIRRAVDLLFRIHEGYARRAEAAMLAGLAKPMPTPDEWAVACGWWRQFADDNGAAYNRFCCVRDILVSVFELNFVATAVRGHLAGEMRSVPHGWWINECFDSWFATCQVDPNFPFMPSAVRFGGDWLYVERDSYCLWRNSAFQSLIDERAREGKPQAPERNVDDESDSRTGNVSADDPRAYPQPHGGTTSPGGQSSSQGNVATEQSEISDLPEVSQPDASGSRALVVDAASAASTDSAGDPTRKVKLRQRKPGNKPRYDWATFQVEVIRRATAEPRPRSERALAGDMLEWCSDNWGKEPSESRARTKIAEILAANGLMLD